MTRPFSLQTVLELTQSRADEAAQQLALLLAAEQDARSKQELLQQYREEYAERFRQMAKNGLTPQEWRNYQEFLNRLDDAVSIQKRTVAQKEQNTANGQQHWKEQQKKLKAMDTLSKRHYASEAAIALKRDQKVQDELAVRRRNAGE